MITTEQGFGKDSQVVKLLSRKQGKIWSRSSVPVVIDMEKSPSDLFRLIMIHSYREKKIGFDKRLMNHFWARLQFSSQQAHLLTVHIQKSTVQEAYFIT